MLNAHKKKSEARDENSRARKIAPASIVSKAGNKEKTSNTFRSNPKTQPNAFKRI